MQPSKCWCSGEDGEISGRNLDKCMQVYLEVRARFVGVPECECACTRPTSAGTAASQRSSAVGDPLKLERRWWWRAKQVAQTNIELLKIQLSKKYFNCTGYCATFTIIHVTDYKTKRGTFLPTTRLQNSAGVIVSLRDEAEWSADGSEKSSLLMYARPGTTSDT